MIKNYISENIPVLTTLDAKQVIETLHNWEHWDHQAKYRLKCISVKTEIGWVTNIYAVKNRHFYKGYNRRQKSHNNFKEEN